MVGQLWPLGDRVHRIEQLGVDRDREVARGIPVVSVERFGACQFVKDEG